VSYFIQMTEDEAKVKRAVAALLGGDLPEEREVVEGHFGNSIALIKHHLTGASAEEAFDRIVQAMAAGERRAIRADLSSVVDEHGALYIRLNKQVLVLRGEASLTSSDPVRIRVKPRAHLVRDPSMYYSRVLEEGSG
jgi:RNA binding exosome subunit